MRIAFKTRAARYVVALACVAVALQLGLLFARKLGDGFSFAAMIVAVMVAGWQGGFGPALMAALAIMRFVLNPNDSFSVRGLESQAGKVLYLVVTVGIAIVTGSMQSMYRRSKQRTADVLRALEEKLLAEQNLNQATRRSFCKCCPTPPRSNKHPAACPTAAMCRPPG